MAKNRTTGTLTGPADRAASAGAETSHAISRGESAHRIRRRLLLQGFSEKDAFRLVEEGRREFISEHAVDREVQAAVTLSELDSLFRSFQGQNNLRGALEVVRLKCRLLAVDIHMPVETEGSRRGPYTSDIEKNLDSLGPEGRERVRQALTACVSDMVELCSDPSKVRATESGEEGDAPA
ncbi:MAG TPA: hypothetical protein VMN04_04185 [Thermoanaerobaculia bacterium]|nr:hypothetical protein [Thermoanaerobaculia bacterium]